MNILRSFLAAGLLAFSSAAYADGDLPEVADWYLHIDFERMRTEQAGNPLYGWLNDEVFADVRTESGIDLHSELDSITAFSVAQEGPIIVMRGEVSQATKDKAMALLAADGSIGPRKASGKNYFRFGDEEDGAERVVLEQSDNLGINFALEEGAWISLDLDDTVLITATEGQMQQLLANKGRVAGTGKRRGALLVLTAEKTLLQAGIDSNIVDDDGESGFESNILRNTEQVAFLIAAAADKLALEAKLVTSEPGMAESLASVARGLISLLAFDDSMEPEAVAMLQSTRVEASGNSLSLSLAVDPQLLVQSLED